MAELQWTKQVVGEVDNEVPPAPMNVFSTVGDVNGNGLPDIVIGGRNGRFVWLENPGRVEWNWTQHLIDHVEEMECGGSLVDLNGSGLPDLINGGDWRSSRIYWWENPGKARGPWTRRLIAETENPQVHDTLIADLTGDGHPSLFFTNQHGGTTIYRIPLPEDPTVSPWPGLEAITRNKTEANPHNPALPNGRQPEEGLAAGDLDGDGRDELVCGTHWYKWAGDRWTVHKFAKGYITTKVAIGDIDGDGRNEIILSEGDPCVYGRTAGGKLAWFKPGDDPTRMWNEYRIENHLLDAHSLQLADLTGDGRLDIFVGEVGLADEETDVYVGRPPRLWIFENEGGGRFARHVIDEGTGTHEAVLADMLARDEYDIIGKPLHGMEKWKVHVWYRYPLPT